MRRSARAWCQFLGAVTATVSTIAPSSLPANASAHQRPWRITITISAFKHHGHTQTQFGCESAREVDAVRFRGKTTMTFPPSMEPGPFLTPATHARETYKYHATESITCPAGAPGSGMWQKTVADSTTTGHVTWASWINKGRHRILDTSDDSGYTTPPNQTNVVTGSSGPPERFSDGSNAAAIHVDLGLRRDLHRGMTRSYKVLVYANEYTATGDPAPYNKKPVTARVTVSVK